MIDHGDDRETQGMRIVGVPIIRGGNGSCTAPPHRGVHQEAVDDHSGEGGYLTRLCTVHKGVEDARDEIVSSMVG